MTKISSMPTLLDMEHAVIERGNSHGLDRNWEECLLFSIDYFRCEYQAGSPEGKGTSAF